MLNGLSTRLLCSVPLLIGALLAQATPLDTNALFLKLHPILTFSTGASFSQLGQSQAFMPMDLCSYHYQPDSSTTTAVLWGGFAGVEGLRTSHVRLTAGLGYYQPNSLSTKGALIQGADANSNNTYRYQYSIQSQQWLAETKLHWVAPKRIQPFFMVGIGAAINHTSNYQTNVPPFLEFTPTFSNQTQAQFTYAVGPGIDIRLSKSYRFGIAYRFTDLGAANTGSAQLDQIPISSTLKQSHLYANQVLAQFTFIPWTKD